MMNVKFIFEKLLIASGVFYYYASALFASNLREVLLYTALFGAIFAAIIVIRYIVLRGLSRSFFIFILTTLSLLAITYTLEWTNVTWIILMAIPLVSIDRDTFMKTIFQSSLLLFSTTVALSIWGPLPFEYINYAGEVEERYGVVKYSLGFDGPNQAAFAWFTILTSGLYTYSSRRTATWLLVLSTLTVGLMTGSRTGLACSLLFIITYLYIEKRGDRLGVPKRTGRLVSSLFIILTIISIATALALKDNPTANDILSQRPKTIAFYLDPAYIPSLFGSVEVYNKAEYQTPPVDNFPVYTLARYGALGFLTLASLLYVSMRNEFSWRIKTIYLFILMYGMTEAFFDIPAKNFLLPLAIAPFIPTTRNKESTHESAATS